VRGEETEKEQMDLGEKIAFNKWEKQVRVFWAATQIGKPPASLSRCFRESLAILDVGFAAPHH